MDGIAVTVGTLESGAAYEVVEKRAGYTTLRLPELASIVLEPHAAWAVAASSLARCTGADPSDDM